MIFYFCLFSVRIAGLLQKSLPSADIPDTSREGRKSFRALSQFQDQTSRITYKIAYKIIRSSIIKTKAEFRMNNYAPPFTINNHMLMLAAEISEKTGQISGLHTFSSKPYLRRNNRIRSVHGSVAIEANSLSLDEVRSVIDGKMVTGPWNEIQEVKNAYQAYELIGSFDPFSLEDLKKMHGIMTAQTVSSAGNFRRHEEGVFQGDVCIFVAPPPRLIPDHMKNLFEWLDNSRKTIHPLIYSSVFHYEFVFIHPFSDGNGRMARLWQTALLSEWNPVFQYLPIESHIHEFQEDYYNAISSSHAAGNSDPFILFMLDKMNLTLDQALLQAKRESAYRSIYVQKLLDIMEYGVSYTAEQILTALGLKSKANLRKNYLLPALEEGLIVMGIPDKPTSRSQTYIRK